VDTRAKTFWDVCKCLCNRLCGAVEAWNDEEGRRASKRKAENAKRESGGATDKTKKQMQKDRSTDVQWILELFAFVCAGIKLEQWRGVRPKESPNVRLAGDHFL
jgi:hypothetical protein